MKLVSVSALSHTGLVRDHNEDSVVLGSWTMCSSVTHSPQTLRFPAADRLVVAVADGLGGHPAGEVASTVAVQHLARVEDLPGDEESVRRMLSSCNRAVYDAAALDDSRTGMGTTVAGVVADEDSLLVFNVGDSRTYILDDEDGLTQVSVDDNPPLGPGETHTPVLTQMLGGHTSYRDVDTHVMAGPWGPGARYLVCTDGLSDVVPSARIESLLSEHRGDDAVHALWRAAIDGGGPDNITLAVVEASQ